MQPLTAPRAASRLDPVSYGRNRLGLRALRSVKPGLRVTRAWLWWWWLRLDVWWTLLMLRVRYGRKVER